MFAVTARNPQVLADLIADHGDTIWLGPDGAEGRYDRYSFPTPANREDAPTVTSTPSKTSADAVKLAKTVKALVGMTRTVVFGRVMIDPIDANAPVGTQVRLIKAYNSLHDLAEPGTDRFCGLREGEQGPCVLKENHPPSLYDDGLRHMDATQRETALRYLTRSNPDPAKRA